ncbi:MAG: Integral membrane sensor signal transduction histidine kinase, partial [Thermovirga lienii]
LRNAIRYTPVGGQIQIKVEDGDDYMIRVSIRDQGEGVPIDQIDKLFKPFYRVETSRNRKKGGVGLGLAIAKRALEYHGGRIEAANAPDGGLVVTMWLPLAKK